MTELKPPLTYDVVFDSICKHILANVEAVGVILLDDYEDDYEPHGYNPNGGAAYHTARKSLVRADATVRVRVRVPFLPKGYRLVQLSPHDFHVPGSSTCHLDANLYLLGPDIDCEAPESLGAALEEVGDELVKKLAPAIRDELGPEYCDDFAEIQKRLRGEACNLAVQFDENGASLTFDAWIRE